MQHLVNQVELIRRILVTLSAFVLFCSYCSAQTRDLTEIKIVSSWGGLGQPAHRELTIKRKSDGYYLNGDRIKASLIMDFVTALDEPVVRKLELANLGITQEWLDANAAAGAEDTAVYFSDAAPNQRELYFSSFKNLKFIEDGLPELFHSGWTDDYPGVQITLKAADGKITTISSDVQSMFMLPWKVERDGSTIENYNAHLSRAIANLLPNKFTNRERIAGTRLREEMAKAVLGWIEDDWKRLDAENKAGSDLARLRSKYTVIASEINGYHNVDYGREMVNGDYAEINLHALLRQPEFPKNFFISAVLQVKEKKVENIDLFLNSIEHYRDMVMQVRWLAKYVDAHSIVRVELRFVTDRSFSERAMRIFAGDMKKLGKVALANEVIGMQKDVALILVGRTYYQAYWLILPDQRMVLWRFRGYDALLKWKADEFDLNDCDEFQSKCVGAIISADGNITSK